MFSNEQQVIENICRDTYNWLTGLPWAYIGCGAIVLLAFIIFVASRNIRDEHVDDKKEGSDWPLHNDIISLSYICDASQLVSSAVEMDT